MNRRRAANDDLFADQAFLRALEEMERGTVVLATESGTEYLLPNGALLHVPAE